MLDKYLFRIPGIPFAIVRNCVFAILYSLFTIGLAAGISFAIVKVWQGFALESVVLEIVLFAICFLARAATECVSDFCSRRFALTKSKCIHEEYMDAAYVMGSCVDRDDSASMAIESVSGIENISQYLMSILPKLTDVVVIPLVLCIAIYTQDVISGIIVTICYPFIMLFMNLIGHSASDDASKRHDGFKRMSSHFVDSLRGIFTLKAFGAARSYAGKVFAASEKYRKMTMQTLKIATLSSAVLDIFATCGLAAVAIMLGFRLVDSQIAFLPSLIVLILVPEFFKPIKMFAADYHSSLEGKASLHFVFDLIANANDEKKKSIEIMHREKRGDIGCVLTMWGRGDEISFNGDRNGLDVSTDEVRKRSSKLIFEDIGFRYSENKRALSNISFSINCGDWTVIVGASGAGKTTLANLLAGFTDPSFGKISFEDSRFSSSKPSSSRPSSVDVLTLSRDEWRSRVAYIPQNPYVFHDTFRNNLRFYDMDASDDQIARALNVVGLEEVVSALPDGLDTVMGDGAQQLSGGQLQRLALARVLLDQRRDVWILDEPTAHLDIETEFELKRQMLPLMRGKTVFIVTHRLHWIEQADNVIKIYDGKMVEFERRPHDRQICDLDEGYLSLSRNEIRKDKLQSDEQGDVFPREIGDVGVFAKYATNAQNASRLKWIGNFFSEHKKLLVLSLVLGLIANIFSSGLMFTSGFMISLAAAIPATALALHVPSIFVRIFGIGKPCISYVERLMSHDWILRITSKLRFDFFRYIDRITDNAKGIKISIGKTLSFLTQTIEHAQNALIRGVLPIITILLTYLIVLIFAAIFSVQLALILGVLFALLIVVMPLVACRRQGENLRSSADARARLMIEANDNIFGLRDWVLSGRISHFIHNADADWESLIKTENKMARAQRFRLLVFNFVFCLSVVVVFIWASICFSESSLELSTNFVSLLGNMPIQDGIAYSPNWIAAFVLCVFPLAEIFVKSSESALEIVQHASSVEKISVIEESLKESDSTVFSHRDKNTRIEILSCVDSDKAIEVSDVKFGYPNLNVSAFSGSVAINQGEHVAVLGRSGAGKSTFIKLITGTLKPMSGSISVFGKELDDTQDIYKRITLVEQDFYIFNQSIRENLLLAKPDATDEEVLNVLKKVKLDETVSMRDNDVDNVMRESGSNVSGGERTRLSLARALLTDAPVVILDEPFSGLDPVTERDILDTLMREFNDRTLVVVTHHLQDIDKFDRVLFFDDGEIVLDGSPKMLVETDRHFTDLIAFENGQQLANI